MNRTMQVIIIIAVICSAVEICSLVVSYIEPPQHNEESYLSNMIARAEIRWKVYWFSGVALALVGLFANKRFELLGNALLVNGIYLMLFGNNGGFWTDGYIVPRLITTFITFLGLLYLIRNECWTRTNQ